MKSGKPQPAEKIKTQLEKHLAASTGVAPPQKPRDKSGKFTKPAK